jgi:phosphoglycolate phosphatase
MHEKMIAPPNTTPLYQGVFFDLDGTLADTAPDLVSAANLLRMSRNLTPLPLETLRPRASAGARGLIYGAFGYDPDHPEFATLRDEFLKNYEQAICVNTRLFDGMNDVLQALETHQIAWGIVTNKVERFTFPLMRALELESRCQATVGGDTTPFSKPHPAPVLKAAELCQLSPSSCLYVGDDLRDIEAGHAAGMKTVAATYGYCGCDAPPDQWGADFIINHPLELIPLIFSA